MKNQIYLAHLDPLVHLLLLCAQSDLHEDEITRIAHLIDSNFLASKTSHDAFLLLSHKHGMLPLVHKTFSFLLKNGHIALRPDIQQLLISLKTRYMYISKANMQMTATLLQLHSTFFDHNIPFVAFKGPALAQKAYGDITLRQFGDLDILISPAHINAALTLLEKDGYTLPPIPKKQNLIELSGFLNVLSLYHPSSDVMLELHWELLSKNYAIRWDDALLWKSHETVTINHTKITAPLDGQHLLYLCIHGAKHLFERMEWINDINRMIRCGDDLPWNDIVEQAEKMGTKRMFFLGLYSAWRFFLTPIPDEIMAQINQDKVVKKLFEKIVALHYSSPLISSKGLSLFGMLLGMREKPIDKLRFAWRGLFCVQYDDIAWLQLPKPLMFLYPLVRISRLMGKYLFKS